MVNPVGFSKQFDILKHKQNKYKHEWRHIKITKQIKTHRKVFQNSCKQTCFSLVNTIYVIESILW